MWMNGCKRGWNSLTVGLAQGQEWPETPGVWVPGAGSQRNHGRIGWPRRTAETSSPENSQEARRHVAPFREPTPLTGVTPMFPAQINACMIETPYSTWEPTCIECILWAESPSTCNLLANLLRCPLYRWEETEALGCTVQLSYSKIHCF